MLDTMVGVHGSRVHRTQLVSKQHVKMVTLTTKPRSARAMMATSAEHTGIQVQYIQLAFNGASATLERVN